MEFNFYGVGTEGAEEGFLLRLWGARAQKEQGSGLGCGGLTRYDNA